MSLQTKKKVGESRPEQTLRVKGSVFFMHGMTTVASNLQLLLVYEMMDPGMKIMSNKARP